MWNKRISVKLNSFIMKTKTLLYTIAVIAFISISISSCEKNNIETLEIEIAEDDVLSTSLFDDVFAEVENAMETMEYMIYDGIKKSASDVVCKTITVEHPNDSTLWPRKVIIDYGEGCVGPNGRERKGKIIIVVNRHYLNADYFRTVTFDNYYINGYKIEGIKTVINEGFNDSRNMYFSVSLSEGKVITPEGLELLKEYNRISEFVTGINTPRFRGDDEYMITGTASGVNRDLISYTRTIIEPLHVASSCKWILSGTVEIVADGRETAILNYGDDTCDNTATVTVGDKSWEIDLRP